MKFPHLASLNKKTAQTVLTKLLLLIATIQQTILTHDYYFSHLSFAKMYILAL